MCYQIPALIFEGLTIVISPLIALMKDQVDALVANVVQAAFLNSTQSTPDQIAVFNAVRDGKVSCSTSLRKGCFNPAISF